MISNPISLQQGEPLAQMLRTIRVTGVLASTITVGSERWATSIPHPEDCIILYIMNKGECVGGTLEPRCLVDLKAGDALLLPSAGRCLMAQSSEVTPVSLESILSAELDGLGEVEAKWKCLFASPFSHARAQSDGVSVSFTALRMFFDQNASSALLRGLSSVVHVRNFVQANDAFVDAMLTQIVEHGKRGLSGQTTATRLAEALLVQVLTQALSRPGEVRPGYYNGLKDPFLSKVICAVQNDPRSEWTLARMSSSAGLSRSALAARFRSVVGMAPAQFVTAVRMARAAEMLQYGNSSIASIAFAAGYGSEAAFNRAFRKWSGSPPGMLRRLPERVAA